MCATRNDMTRADGGLRIGFDLRYLQAAYRNSASGGLGGAGVYIQGLWLAMVRLFPDRPEVRQYRPELYAV